MTNNLINHCKFASIHCMQKGWLGIRAALLLGPPVQTPALGGRISGWKRNTKSSELNIEQLLVSSQKLSTSEARSSGSVNSQRSFTFTLAEYRACGPSTGCTVFGFREYQPQPHPYLGVGSRTRRAGRRC